MNSSMNDIFQTDFLFNSNLFVVYEDSFANDKVDTSESELNKRPGLHKYKYQGFIHKQDCIYFLKYDEVWLLRRRRTSCIN